MINGRLIVAHHGCDITTRDDLVTGRLKQLRESRNRYDWLGPGTYLFENDAERALLFAQRSANNPGKQYTAKAVATPAVVCAVINAHSWLDMTTQAGLNEFKQAYTGMQVSLPDVVAKLSNKPSNDEDKDVLLRHLDAGVFRYLHEIREEHGLPPFQVVRGAFRQGDEIAPGSGFHTNTHVQIAVVDPSCFAGWFLCPGDKLLSPEAYAEAKVRLQEAQKTWKPRQTAKAAD